MPLDDEQWSALARELRRAAARVAPGWTDSGTHDPGVTVLELLAYALADQTVEPDADGARVVVAPGLAFDPRGREIFVGACCRLTLPAANAALLVQLSYRERACRSVAIAGEAVDDGRRRRRKSATQPTRIVETFDATLAATPAADAVSVARVHRLRGRWRVDPKFAVPRVRR